MKNLGSLNKYFVKYKWRLILGLIFVAVSSKFAVMPGNVIRDILDEVQAMAAKNSEAVGNHICCVQRRYVAAGAWHYCGACSCS